MDILRNGITAHRGDLEKFPENTIEAFKSGIESGADWLELDIRFTADRHLVVIHDHSTGRTADRDLIVAESTLVELKQLDMSFQFKKKTPDCPVLRIPTLSEVFEATMTEVNIGISIQPKNQGVEGLKAVENAIALADKLGMVDSIGFNDGQLDLMKHVKEINSAIPVFYDLYKPAPKDVRAALESGFETLVVFKNYVSAEWINDVKKHGLLPGAWTVNDISEALKFRKMGIERLYTDYPGIMLDAFNANR